MSRKAYHPNFSGKVFGLVLLLSCAVILLCKRSPWLLAAALIPALLSAFLAPCLRAAWKKFRYLRVLEKHAGASFAEIMSNARRMLTDPAEVECVHQLRVSIRRYRAILSLAKPHIPPERYLCLQDFFRQRGAELAALREMDVLTDTLRQISDLKDSLLLERFQALRAAEQEKVVRLLDTAYIEELKKRHGEFLDEVRKADARGFTGGFDDRLENWDRFIARRLPQIHELPWAKVHRVRIKSKKARYITEIFQNEIDAGYGGRAKEYKRIQSELGVRCDQLRNLEAIDEWIENDTAEIMREKEIFRAWLLGEEGSGEAPAEKEAAEI